MFFPMTVWKRGSLLQQEQKKRLLEVLRSLKKNRPVLRTLNCTPFVRQYVILNNKWGALLCQKEYRTRDILQNSKKLL